MRLALATTILMVAAVPVRVADAARDKDLAAIATAVETYLATGACPEYRVNHVRLTKLREKHGLTRNLVIVLHRAQYDDILQSFRREAAADQAKLCFSIWDEIGEAGEAPHIVEKRD